MYPNKYRTVNHPHSNFVINEDSTLGFVRISKCGSSTFAERHNLFTWKPFKYSKNIDIILCCLRNPFARFISSIPETLTRIYTSEDENTKFPWTDVNVSKDIYEFLSINNSSDPLKTLDTFIKAIIKFGYFDAHHEPMTNFLLNKKKDIEINPLIFDLKNMDLVSRYLYSFQGKKNINLSYSNVRNFENSYIQRINKLEKIKSENALRKFKHYLEFLQWENYSKNSFSPVNFHLRDYRRRNFLPFRSNLSKHISLMLDKAIDKRKNKLNAFLKEYYKDDLDLYRNLLKYKKRFKFTKLISTLPKLSELK